MCLKDRGLGLHPVVCLFLFLLISVYFRVCWDWIGDVCFHCTGQDMRLAGGRPSILTALNHYNLLVLTKKMLEMAGGQIGWGWYVVSHPLAGREWSWERSLLTASQRYSVQRAVTVAAVKCLSVFISWGCRTKSHELGGLKSGSVSPRSPGGWKSEVKVWAALVPSEGCRGACSLPQS